MHRSGKHNYASYLNQEVKQPKPTTEFSKLSLEKFKAVVNKAGISNSDASYDAIRKADIVSFWTANTWLRDTEKNVRLINHYLDSKGITHQTFPDFQMAADALAAEGVLDVHGAEFASYQDGVRPSKYRNPITGQTYDSLDALIANGHNDALHTVPQRSKEEIDFDALPLEEVQALCKAAVQAEEAAQNAPQNQLNADAFLTNHREIFDNEHNARMISMQLKADGVTGVVTQAQYEHATEQLNASGLLTLNKNVLAKQRAAEVQRTAAEHVVENLSEEDMENLPLDELRKRANQQLASRK